MCWVKERSPSVKVEFSESVVLIIEGLSNLRTTLICGSGALETRSAENPAVADRR